jgi:hypothetical protein
MGSLGSVFSRWRRHVKTNIHGSSSMAWAATGTPVVATTNFYIVGDLDGATECYVTAHGGANDSDYFFDNKTFRVPDGVSINFYQPHGYILGAGTSSLRNGKPDADPNATDLHYTGGEDCVNYILAKDQGRHLSGDANYAAQWEMDYSGTQAVAGDMGIVMVTVRNRWFHAGVTLKSCISEVTGAAPGIKTFNCLFCRVTDGSTNDVWESNGGYWTQ